ncbi:MAG: periplasmic heavy metal sensor [Pseudomonadota bacterium]|jgi:Spy/CpxP family protein refolding chaperone
MNRNTVIVRKTSILALALGAALLAVTPAMADRGSGPSQDEMQRMMPGRGYGAGMDSGMMGGGGGMMGGMGMMDMMMGGGMGGMGMMGGGMMGMGPLAMLDLSDEQRAKVRKIEDEQRKKSWDLMGKMMDESAKLRELYDADALDAKKIGVVYDKIFDLKRQAIVAGIESSNRARTVLTKEQQEQLKQWRRGGMGMGGGTMGSGQRGYVPGNMPRDMMGR